MKMNTIKLLNEHGETVVYDVLFTFENADNGKKYIIYTDHSKDTDGSVSVYASYCDSTVDPKELTQIEAKEEWDLIQQILDTLQTELRKDPEKDAEEIVNEVLENVNNQQEDIYMYEEYLDKYKHLKDHYMNVILHIYEKDSNDLSTHAKHHKIGVARLSGNAGRFLIGSSIINDIRLKDSNAVDSMHMMGILWHRNLYISNLSKKEVTLNHISLPMSEGEEQFYAIGHKQYFTIGNKYKIYVEKLYEYAMVEKKCAICGKKFYSMGDIDTCCVDCFKQNEEEMQLDLPSELKVIDFSEHLYPRQSNDLEVDFEASNPEDPQLLSSLFTIWTM